MSHTVAAVISALLLNLKLDSGSPLLAVAIP